MAIAIPPMWFTWNGEAFVPLPHFRKMADRHYVVEENYPLVPHLQRSDISHRHEFAWLKTAWLNLPEGLAEQFPTPNHLRKRALIDSGWYNETVIDAGNNAAALRMASYVRSKDEFAVVIVRGRAVVIREAKSQSYRAMGKEDFQRSKDDVMNTVADMVGVTPAELERETGKAA